MAALSDIKLEASNLAATKPKHVFGKIKCQSVVYLQNRENGSSQKDNAENRVT